MSADNFPQVRSAGFHENRVVPLPRKRAALPGQPSAPPPLPDAAETKRSDGSTRHIGRNCRKCLPVEESEPPPVPAQTNWPRLEHEIAGRKKARHPIPNGCTRRKARDEGPTEKRERDGKIFAWSVLPIHSDYTDSDYGGMDRFSSFQGSPALLFPIIQTVTKKTHYATESPSGISPRVIDHRRSRKRKGIFRNSGKPESRSPLSRPRSRPACDGMVQRDGFGRGAQAAQTRAVAHARGSTPDRAFRFRSSWPRSKC